MSEEYDSMITSGVYLGRSFGFVSLALGLFVPFAASAQGRIDPSLPSEPLAFHRKFLMTPGIDTVKDPHAVLPPPTTREKYRLFWLRTANISMPVKAAFFAGAKLASLWDGQRSLCRALRFVCRKYGQLQFLRGRIVAFCFHARIRATAVKARAR
jgi:hypothetical protein